MHPFDIELEEVNMTMENELNASLKQTQVAQKDQQQHFDDVKEAIVNYEQVRLVVLVYI